MPVSEIKQGMALEVNRVFCLLPGKDMFTEYAPLTSSSLLYL
jgi:hypothetical protein